MLYKIGNIVIALAFLVAFLIWLKWVINDELELYPLIGFGIASIGGLIASIVYIFKNFKEW